MWPRVAVSTGLVNTSPSGKFWWPSALTHVRPDDVEGEVGVLAQDAQLADALQLFDDPLLARRLLAPEGDRVGIAQVPGRVHEVLPLGQRHARVLGGGVARVGGAAPVHLAQPLALEEALEERPHRRRADGLAVGVDPAREAVVALRPDAERARGRLDLDLVEPRHRPQLVVARLGQKRRLALVRAACAPSDARRARSPCAPSRRSGAGRGAARPRGRCPPPPPGGSSGRGDRPAW